MTNAPPRSTRATNSAVGVASPKRCTRPLGAGGDRGRRRPRRDRCARRRACRVPCARRDHGAQRPRRADGIVMPYARAVVVDDLDVVGPFGDPRVDERRRLGCGRRSSGSACRTGSRGPRAPSPASRPRRCRRGPARRPPPAARARICGRERWSVNMSSSVVTPKTSARSSASPNECVCASIEPRQERPSGAVDHLDAGGPRRRRRPPRSCRRGRRTVARGRTCARRRTRGRRLNATILRCQRRLPAPAARRRRGPRRH